MQYTDLKNIDTLLAKDLDNTAYVVMHNSYKMTIKKNEATLVNILNGNTVKCVFDGIDLIKDESGLVISFWVQYYSQQTKALGVSDVLELFYDTGKHFASWKMISLYGKGFADGTLDKKFVDSLYAALSAITSQDEVKEEVKS